MLGHEARTCRAEPPGDPNFAPAHKPTYNVAIPLAVIHDYLAGAGFRRRCFLPSAEPTPIRPSADRYRCQPGNLAERNNRHGTVGG